MCQLVQLRPPFNGKNDFQDLKDLFANFRNTRNGLVTFHVTEFFIDLIAC